MGTTRNYCRTTSIRFVCRLRFRRCRPFGCCLTRSQVKKNKPKTQQCSRANAKECIRVRVRVRERGDKHMPCVIATSKHRSLFMSSFIFAVAEQSKRSIGRNARELAQRTAFMCKHRSLLKWFFCGNRWDTLTAVEAMRRMHWICLIVCYSIRWNAELRILSFGLAKKYNWRSDFIIHIHFPLPLVCSAHKYITNTFYALQNSKSFVHTVIYLLFQRIVQFSTQKLFVIRDGIDLTHVQRTLYTGACGVVRRKSRRRMNETNTQNHRNRRANR